MNRYVLDTSALIKKLLVEPGSAQVDRLFMQAVAGTAELLTVDFAFLEAANVLWKRCIRGVLTADTVHKLVIALRGLGRDVTVVHSRDVLEAAVAIAVKAQVAVYDAAFIALSDARQAPLVTADRKQAQAVSRVVTAPPPVVV